MFVSFGIRDSKTSLGRYTQGNMKRFNIVWKYSRVEHGYIKWVIQKCLNGLNKPFGACECDGITISNNKHRINPIMEKIPVHFDPHLYVKLKKMVWLCTVVCLTMLSHLSSMLQYIFNINSCCIANLYLKSIIELLLYSLHSSQVTETKHLLNGCWLIWKPLKNKLHSFPEKETNVNIFLY